MALFSIPIPRFRKRKMKMPAPGASPGTLSVSAELPPPVVSVFFRLAIY